VAAQLVASGVVLSPIELVTHKDVAWIGVAQNRYRWRALVNTVMNLRVL
jgi:hypothetical protein